MCTKSACDISVSHGGKAHLKVRTASQKHQNYVRAACLGNVRSFFQKNLRRPWDSRRMPILGIYCGTPLSVVTQDHCFRKWSRSVRTRRGTTVIDGEMSADAENTMTELLKCHAFAVSVGESNEGTHVWFWVPHMQEKLRSPEFSCC